MRLVSVTAHLRPSRNTYPFMVPAHKRALDTRRGSRGETSAHLRPKLSPHPTPRQLPVRQPLPDPAKIDEPDDVDGVSLRVLWWPVTAEFDEYQGAFADQQLSDGRRWVVRNGHLPERQILTGIGAVDVQVPKARSRSGAVEPFRS